MRNDLRSRGSDLVGRETLGWSGSFHNADRSLEPHSDA